MVTIEKITPAMFDDIHALFLAEDDPRSTKEDWSKLFAIRPGHESDGCGVAIVDGGRIGGVLGMTFSQRELNGQVHRLCNLHSWFVDEAYRGSSLRLLRQAIALPDCTLTDFTPTERVCDISCRLGFKLLDSRLRILLPATPLRGRAAANDFDITDDPAEIATILRDEDARLFHDHQGPGFGHLLATGSGGYCYVIFSRIDRHVLPYCYLHFISNLPQFEAVQGRLRRRLLRLTSGRYVAVDDRRVASIRLPWSYRMPLGTRQLFRSQTLQPGDIDSLYSEVAALRLSTMPSLRRSIPWPGASKPRVATARSR